MLYNVSSYSNSLGMHVAVCAFDKTVSLFDFFSGDLLAQVSGHSELITAVRFSPDGRFLLSVGGDGCIMKWALAERLVEGMQERLLELVTAHKMKMTKPDSASSSRRESRDAPVSPSKLPMPMPPSRDSSVSPPPPGQSRGTAGGVRTGGIRDRDLPVPSSGDSEGSDRWASRVDQQSYDSHSRRNSNESEPTRKYTSEMNAEDLRNIEKDNSVFRLPPKGGLGGIVEDYEDDPEKDDATEMANRKLDGLESWLEDLVSKVLFILFLVVNLD
jgi:WD40 repeat protein